MPLEWQPRKCRGGDRVTTVAFVPVNHRRQKLTSPWWPGVYKVALGTYWRVWLIAQRRLDGKCRVKGTWLELPSRGPRRPTEKVCGLALPAAGCVRRRVRAENSSASPSVWQPALGCCSSPAPYRRRVGPVAVAERTVLVLLLVDEEVVAAGGYRCSSVRPSLADRGSSSPPSRRVQRRIGPCAVGERDRIEALITAVAMPRLVGT